MLRATYLLDIAAIYHCPPPLLDKTRVIDFARMIAGLDQMKAQQGG